MSAREKDGELHPRLGHDAEEIRHDIAEEERRDAGDGAAGDPLQLLAQNRGGRAAVAETEDQRGGEEIESDVGQLDAIENDARADGRENVDHSGGHGNVQQQQNHGGAVDGEQLGPEAAATFRKDQRKVDEQRRREKHGDDVAPINFPIEDGKLSAVVEAVKDERGQAEEIEMHGARSVPAARENEQANENIDQAGDAEIVLEGGGIFGVGGDELGVEGGAVALDAVGELGPFAGAEEHLSDLGGTANIGAANGFDVVAGLDASLFGGRAGSNVPGLDAGAGVQPGDAVIGDREGAALIEIFGCEDNGGEGDDDQGHRANAHSQSVVH